MPTSIEEHDRFNDMQRRALTAEAKLVKVENWAEGWRPYVSSDLLRGLYEILRAK